MKRQQGFVLIGVIFVLFVIASVSLVLNREGVMDVRLAGDELSISKARQAALAGVNHLVNSANQSECKDYNNITTTVFGSSSYSATISPDNGSPVKVSATATLADGTVSGMVRDGELIYQAPKPDLAITSAEGEGKDAYLSNIFWARDTNFGNATLLTSGNSIFAKFYSLFKFDLSSLPPNIRILSADLQLYLSSITTFKLESSELSVHRMLVDWTEGGATWNKSDGSAAWTVPNIFEVQASSTLGFDSSNNGLRVFDVTRLVEGWSNGIYANYGFALAANSDLGSVKIASGEASDPAQVPTLTIRYTCECGLDCDIGDALPKGIAHWKLDETSGTTAKDSVGTNDGKTAGSTWTKGQIDGAAQFDGISDYIIVPHAKELVFNKKMTISAWIYPRSIGTKFDGYHTIVVKGTGFYVHDYWFGIWQNELVFAMFDSAGVWQEIFTTGLPLKNNTWYHVAVTFDIEADDVVLYVDGFKVGGGKFVFDPPTGNQDLQIGRTGQGDHWNGNLDDIRLFDNVLLPEEVEALAGGNTPIKFETVLDQFNARNFSGSDGSLPWTGDWKELGESDGPTSGDVQVTSYGGRDYVIAMGNNDNGGEGVQREANLQSCKTGELNFQYRRRGFDNANDYVMVTISDDGGLSWTKLVVLDGPGTDPNYVPVSLSVTDHISKSTVVRFLTSPTLGGNDVMYIDDIEFRLTDCP